MPTWTNQDKRQYDAIKSQQLEDGVSDDRAEEIAARTVNKRRRLAGRTPNKTTQGTGSPHVTYEERTVEELRNLASEMKIKGRSKLTRKSELIKEIRKRR